VKSVHDRHAERSAKQYDLQRLDMFNSKKYVPKKTVERYPIPGSVYIISTASANSVKTKFYTEDLPSLEDVS
jgi:hypothetical protein